VIDRAVAAGEHEVAAQLAAGHLPDDAALRFFAAEVGGGLVVDQGGDFGAMVYGDGPLAVRVLWSMVGGEDGHQSGHFELLQSWLPQVGPVAPAPAAAAAVAAPPPPEADLAGAPAPEVGDRILVLKPKWLELILSGAKTLEIRGSRLQPGPAWLGTGGRIHGGAIIGAAVPITTAEQWRALLPEHGVETAEPMYKNTWGLPLAAVRRLREPVAYLHPRGAIGVVTYRGPPAAVADEPQEPLAEAALMPPRAALAEAAHGAPPAFATPPLPPPPPDLLHNNDMDLNCTGRTGMGKLKKKLI
jgi:hypothetical protein